MRLAHPHPPATRQGRMDQMRRDRAIAQVMRAVYPSIHQLRIELKFEGASANTPASQSHVLFPPARAFFGYPCPYSDCDGQFDLGEAVKAALANDEHLSLGVLECSGSRPRDYASRQPCQLHIRYEVTATYHDKA
jgi:hypothetical protein